MKCPLCGSTSAPLGVVNTGRFDQSSLYSVVRIMSCDRCSHTFNEVSADEIRGITAYYLGEYLNCHPNITVREYRHPYAERYAYLNTAYIVAQTNLKHYVDTLCFGLDDKTYPAIVLDNFLEHCTHPVEVLTQACRNLEEGGKLFVEVPDADAYSDTIPYYSFLMREHIQHFNLSSLKNAAKLAGLKLHSCRFGNKEILRGYFMPTIEAVFDKEESSAEEAVRTDSVQKYLNKQRIVLPDLKKLDVCCYGIGREFLHLYANGYFDYCRSLTLVDTTPEKAHYTVGGHKIHNELKRDANVLITAFAHKKEITQNISNLGINLIE